MMIKKIKQKKDNETLWELQKSERALVIGTYRYNSSKRKIRKKFGGTMEDQMELHYSSSNIRKKVYTKFGKLLKI